MTKSSAPSPSIKLICLAGALFSILSAFGTSAAQSPQPIVSSDSYAFGPVHFPPPEREFHHPELAASFEVKGAVRFGSTETHPRPYAPLSNFEEETTQVPEELDVTDRESSGPAESVVPESGSRPSIRPLPWKSRFLKDGNVEDDSDAAVDSQNGVSEKFHWRSAVLQSIMIQGVQHAYAIAVQERMRRELKGPWFKDWFKSVRGLHGWDDGNKFFTNYVAHPWQGAMTGFIFVQNHDRLKKQKFAESKTYWVDRLKAMAWSAAWSTQWEIGPFSQAAIGNVGLKKGMAYVDLVMTPTAGTGWMVLEEAIDRYVVRHVEERTNFFVKIFLRTLLNPMRGVANALRFKPPWYRDRPFGG